MKSLSSLIHACLVQNDTSFIIASESMDICRILSIHKFSIVDLVDMEVFPSIFSTSVWSVMLACSENRFLLTLMAYFT